MHPKRITERFPYELDGESAEVVAENVPVEVSAVYLAEDHLWPAERGQEEAEFAAFFGKYLAGWGGKGQADPSPS